MLSVRPVVDSRVEPLPLSMSWSLTGRAILLITTPGLKRLVAPQTVSWFLGHCSRHFLGPLPSAPLPNCPRQLLHRTAQHIRVLHHRRDVLPHQLRIHLLHLDQRDALQVLALPLDPPELHVHVTPVPLHPGQGRPLPTRTPPASITILCPGRTKSTTCILFDIGKTACCRRICETSSSCSVRGTSECT